MYPYDNQIYQQLLQNIQQTSLTKQEVVKVNGRPGAEAFTLAADSSALLLDTSAPIVWLVQTDGAGYKSLLPYDITPHEEKPPEDKYKSLEERITKLEESINGKSNTSNVKRRTESAE